MVIERLNQIQERFGYIPARELNELAAELGKAVHDLHGVASFYPHYRLQPPPRATLYVCGDVSCHMKGAPLIRERLDTLAKASGGQVEVKHCSCLGQCDGAPAMLVDEDVQARMSPDELLATGEQVIAGKEIPHRHYAPAKPHEGTRFKTDPYESESTRYSTLRNLVSTNGFDTVIPKLAAANLKGMGGAGFPTSRKWETVKNTKSDQKYVICNADECEVGTFKDRELLKVLPYLVIEAMTIAALTVGADTGYIYVRHEYHEQIHILEEELRKARILGVVGDNVCGSGKKFDLRVFTSPGGYVQGEETALIEAIEGHRGQPRNKPVDVGLPGITAMRGLHGQPTVLNNVETFAYATLILAKGEDYWKKLGVNGCEGVKWIGVSGDVRNPGVFEVPMGTTYHDAFYKLAGGPLPGRKFKGFAPSGPSFGILPADKMDLKMDWGTAVKPVGRILGSGALVAVDDTRCVLDLALNFTRFYRNESCGKCVPCRVGSQKLVDLILGLSLGTAGDKEMEAVPRLADTLLMTSICGLGQVVPAPILSLMEYFRDEIDAHTKQKRCPANVCRTAAAAGAPNSAGFTRGHHSALAPTAASAIGTADSDQRPTNEGADPRGTSTRQEGRMR